MHAKLSALKAAMDKQIREKENRPRRSDAEVDAEFEELNRRLANSKFMQQSPMEPNLFGMGPGTLIIPEYSPDGTVMMKAEELTDDTMLPPSAPVKAAQPTREPQATPESEQVLISEKVAEPKPSPGTPSAPEKADVGAEAAKIEAAAKTAVGTNTQHIKPAHAADGIIDGLIDQLLATPAPILKSLVLLAGVAETSLWMRLRKRCRERGVVIEITQRRVGGASTRFVKLFLVKAAD